MNEKPFITEIDVGCFKPPKFAIFWPLPVYRSKTGTLYNIHPAQRFKTEQAAQKKLEKLLPKYLAMVI